MDTHLITPVNGVIDCVSIDPHTTKNAEDGVRLSVLGNICQIDIVVIAPDFLVRNPSTPPQIKNLPYILGLEKSPKRVLVCSYVFTTTELLLCEVNVGLARTLRITHKSITKKSYDVYKEYVMILLGLLGTLSPCSENRQRRGDLIELLMYIFNETCREAALRINSPFIAKVDGKILLNDSRAIFNQPLRNTQSRINIANLVCRLRDKVTPERYTIQKIYPGLFEKT